MTRGFTFMIDDQDGAGEHLHVILTAPAETDEVVTVSISTERPRSEKLVRLAVGDHPFIRHPSVCPYRFANIRTCLSIAAAIKAGQAREKEQASEELLQKLEAGLCESDFTPPGIVTFYKLVTQL